MISVKLADLAAGKVKAVVGSSDARYGLQIVASN